MSIRPDAIAAALPSMAEASLAPVPGGPMPGLAVDLLAGRLSLARLSDDTVVLIRADGVREVLSPEQTAALALVLLRAAQSHSREEGALLRLYAIAAARNIQEAEPASTGATLPPPDEPAPESDGAPSPPPLPPEPGLQSETTRFSSGLHNPDNAQFVSRYSAGFIGPARGHLDGLPDEDLRFRDSARRGLYVLDIGDQATPLAGDIGEKRTADGADQNAFGSRTNSSSFESGFVGPGLLHLDPLRNEDYRFSEIPPRPLVSSTADEGVAAGAPPIPVPLQLIDLRAGEDQPIVGTVFPDGLPAGGVVRNMAITQQPLVGTVSIDEDGDFTVALPPHFSGQVVFTYSYADGSGLQRTSTVIIPVEPVADAAALTGGAAPFIVDEDSSGALNGLGAALVDRDGSESLTRIAIEGVPAHVSFTDAAGLPLGRDAGGGVWIFQLGDMERLHLVSGSHLSGDVPLILVATSTETANGDAATTRMPFTVTISPVADAPDVQVGPGVFTGREDEPIGLGGLAVSLVDRDGSESLQSVLISDVPAGGRFLDAAGGPVGQPQGGGVWFFTPAELATLRFVPPLHASGPFDMRLTAVSRETANGDMASASQPFRVVAAPVADAPNVSASSVTGGEDTPIALVSLAASLVDADGSESISLFRILGVPAGARFVDAAGNPLGVDQGGGIWSFAPGDLPSIRFIAPLHLHGDIPLVLEATSQETANADAATSRAPFVVTVTAIADAPVVPARTSSGDEDASIVFGADIAYSLVDADGSESVTSVTLAGFPAGSAVVYMASGGAAVSLAGGVYTISGPPAAIRATLDSFAVTPPPNSDANFSIAVGVTTTDAGGSSAAQAGAHLIRVAAVADAPGASGSASGNEDSDIPLVIAMAETDADGTQSLTEVQLTVPAGKGVIGWTPTPGASIVAAGGVYTVTGTDAAIRALVATLTIRPALHSDEDFSIAVRVTSSETNPSEAAAGEVAALSAATTFSLPVVVAGVADAPAVNPASSRGDEDAAIAFGVAVTYALTDADGSESVTAVALSGFPAGSAVTYALSGAASVGVVAGVYTITGTPSEIRATLDSFAVRPPANSDANFMVAVAVTTTDAGGSIAIGSGTHQIIVDAVADAPTASGIAVGTEDSVPVSITLAETDADGSQSITSVRLVTDPSTMTLTWTPQPGATVSVGPGGAYEVSGDDAAIRMLLTTIVATPPTNLGGTFHIEVTVTSSETSPTESGEVSVLSASSSFTLPVVAGDVADAPTVVASPATGDEDTPILFGASITYALADTDGSEVIAAVAISGAPTGAAVTYAVAAGASVSIAAGVWTITGTEAAIRATLDSFAVRPPVDSDANFALSVAVTAQEGAGSTAVANASVPIVVRAAADAPTGSGSASGAEDSAIPLTISMADADVDGSQSITAVRIADVPAGGSLSWTNAAGATVTNLGGGSYEIAGSEAAISAVLATLAFTPPPHLHGVVNLSVTLTSSETNPSEAGEIAVPSASSSFTLPVMIAAVADAPVLTAPAAAGEEDTRIPLSGIAVSLADADGSESITSIRILGVPAGARFTDAAGTTRGVDNLDGTWTFAPGDLAGLHFLPPLHIHGVVALTLEATATEASNGLASTATQSFTVTVDAQADAPSVAGTSSAISEDALTVIGVAMSYGLVDADGSERVSAVDITGFPAGSTVSIAAAGAAVVNAVAGGYRITGSAADIRATLDGLALQAPANADEDFDLAVSVTTTDADGSTATASGLHRVNVAAVADAPTISGSASGDEDAVITIPVVVSLTDADGSETLTSVEVSQIPAGATLGWNLGLPGMVTVLAGNVHRFTGSTAEIQALLLSLTIQPPLHSDADFNLRITAVSTETNPSGGQIAVASATQVFDVPVTVAAIADQATIPTQTSTVNEDSSAVFGANIAYSLVDADGSETVTAVTLSGFPAGAAVAYMASGAAVVGLAAGTYTITGTAAEIRATLDSFAVTPPSNADANFSLAVGVTTTDTDGSTATQTGAHDIRVAAVADAPTASGSASGNADTDIPLTISMAQTDADGSQSLIEVRLTLPAGSGTIVWTPTAGAAVAVAGDVYTVTGTDAAIRALVATLKARPAPQSDQDYAIAVRVTSSETNPTEVGIGEVAVLSAATTFSLAVTVAAVGDPVVAADGSSTGVEDTTIIFGADVAYALADADGSEAVTEIIISGVPAGWTLAYTATGGGSVDASTPGVWRITGAQAAIRATLDTFRLTPPLDLHGDAALTIAITTTDVDVDTAATSTATRTITHTVVAAADADTPTVAVGTGSFNGVEDTAVALTGFAAALTDTDAGAGRPVSEVFDVIRITGVPAGASFQDGAAAAVGVDQGGGVWTFTAAQLADLRFMPPPNLSGVFNMTLEAVAREQSNNDLSATVSASFSVTIVDIPDTPIVTTGASTGDEDTAILFGPDITYVQPDNLDGSEFISEVLIQRVPVGWAVTYSATGGGVVDVTTPGVWKITGTEAGIRATLDTFRVQPPSNADADLAGGAGGDSIEVIVTSRDSSGGTATAAPAYHNITVTAVADTPSVGVGAGAFSTNEDTRVLLSGFSVAPTDADGSESISLVRITGVSVEAGTGFENAAGTNIGTNLGGGIWTFTKAQIDAGIYYRPGTNRSGVYNMVLEGTAQESSNGVTALASQAFSVTVAGVPDQVTLNAVSSLNLNEDTLTAATGVTSLGALINLQSPDGDGSQTMTVLLGNLPTGTGSNITLTASGGAVITSPTTSQRQITGSTTAVIATLNSLRVRPPSHSDVDFAITVAATTTENGSTLATVNGVVNVTVLAVADTPTLTGGAVTRNEDATGTVIFTLPATHPDNTEYVDFVELRLAGGTPAGTLLLFNSAAATTAGITVTDLGGGVWRLTTTTTPTNSAQATAARTAIRTYLSGGNVTLDLADHRGENVTVQAQVQMRELATGVGQVATATAISLLRTYVVTVTDVADKPDVAVPLSVPTEEDTPVTLTGLGIVKVDSDGSETFTLQLAGVPAGATFTNAADAPVGTNLGGGSWRFTEAQVAGLKFVPPFNLHGAWVITATTTATEAENASAATSDPRNFTIVVDAQADAPTIATAGATGDEDSAVNFGATLASPTLGVALFDTDGSERIASIEISNFPGGVIPTYALVGAASVSAVGGVYTVTGPNEADIRATVATFSMTPPLHSDANIGLTIRASTIDADGSTATSAAVTHTVVVRAVADQPNLSVTGAASGAEDVSIPLVISADRIDADGSEVLSVRITLPGGVSTGTILGNTAGGGAIAHQGAGVWLITAPTEAQLDALLATLSFRPPGNWSGTANLTIEAIATETGPEIQTATASRSATIAVTVGAVADAPALKVVPSIGGASGLEDQPIRLAITVTLPDGDGSESYVVRLSNQPGGAVYTNASGTPIGTLVAPGVWEFTSAQLAVLHIVAPFHSSDNFSLDVEAIVTDTGPTGNSVVTVTGVLPVNVIGVADAPTVITPASVTSAEDQPIPLGLSITASLVDTDGSETLYYVISGLPTGVVPSRGTYIGGEWQISAADMPFVTIPAPPNFSGDYVATFAPALSVRAVAQENDGDETVSNIALDITITPVVDGFSWSPAVTLAEESAISLAGAAFSGTLPDSDGSETIVSYTLDLNGIVAAAQIGGVVPTTAGFIASHITGSFTDNGDGTITVAAANMASVSFNAAAFRDSNVNFSLPISARIQESNGAFQIVSSSFAVALDGIADIPTVFASAVTGQAGTLIQLNPSGAEFGGASTDTDIALGRSLSERIYYIVSGLQSDPGVTLALTNASGQIVGLDNGDGTWYLEPADLADVRMLSSPGSNGMATLTLTTVAVENDTGSRAQSATSASFTVTITPGSGGAGDPPLAPQVTVSLSSAAEDGTIPINVTAVPAPGDTTNPTVSVMFSNIPPGFTLLGATFNPTTGRWIATAADVNAGNIVLRPPANWSGSLTGVNTIQVEALAVNASLNKASTGLLAAPITVTASADGPAFGAAPAAGVEDTAIALNLTVAAADSEASSPETVLTPIIVTIPAGSSLSAGTPMGGNVWHLTPAQLAGLALTPPPNFHGPLSVTVQATTQDVDGSTASGSTTINLSVAARADMPNATANAVSGGEDSPIALTGLSAALVDADGSEVLSVKISGVPVGAIFSAGGNNGDGTWTIPVAALATLQITPPPQFSGVMNLSLIAYSLEQSNGDTSLRTVPFTVTVAPSADIVILDAVPVVIAEEGSAALNLGVVLEDKLQTHPGENPPETVEITFSGLPTGAAITGPGALVDLGGGSWRFTGTEAQANALSLTAPPNYAGVSTVTISAVTIDGAAVLAVPATDTFLLTVTAVADTPVLQTNPVTGLVGAALPLNLAAYPSDADGSESLTITLGNLQAGTTFSAGVDLGGGSWRFTQAQLSGLTMTLPAGATNRTITVSATATEASNGSVATANGTIALTVGSGGMSLVGTAVADTLTGGAGADTLSGAAAADALIGGAGDDVYILDNAGDIVTELAGGGTDRIETALAAYALGAEVENLTFTGGGAFTGAGNTLANRITGGAGADTLNGGDGNDTLTGAAGDDSLVGGLGADSMAGGANDDIYVVDNAGDIVTELAGAGTDQVSTTLAAYALGAEIENLTFIGAGAFTGAGNTLANRVTGDASNDSLSGGGGADTLSGGGGADTLLGGQGADVFTGGAGADTIRYVAGDLTGGPDSMTDFTAGAGGDVIDLDALLPGYDNNPLTLSNYVNLLESGGSTSLRIDATGSANFTTTVLTLTGVTGLDLNTLRSNGNIVT